MIRRPVPFALFLGLAVVALGATAKPAGHHTSEGWTYRSSPDKVRGGENTWACTRSTNAVRLGLPYRAQALELCVRNRQSDGLSIYLDLPYGGQFECPDSDGCSIEASFDGAKPDEISATTPDDGSDDTIFLGDENTVLEELKASKRAVFEVTFYNAGDQQLSFNVANLKWNLAPPAAVPAPVSTPVVQAPEAVTPAGPITDPDWIHQPNGDEFARFYPDRAQRMGISGRVALHCSVNANGTLDCSVSSEEPADQDFGSAALKVSKLFKMRPMTKSGVPVSGGTIELPITFSPAPSGN